MRSKHVLTTLTLFSISLLCNTATASERRHGAPLISILKEEQPEEPSPAPVLASGPFIPPIQENKKEEVNPSTLKKPERDETCSTSAAKGYMNLRHIEANGIGYKHGYSTAELFFANSEKSFIPFLDLRGHLFNTGKFAGNVGLGFRNFPSESSRAFGANIFYDFRRERKHNFHQVGLGLESLGAVWDFRANGYIPVGSNSDYFDSEFHEFDEHEIILRRKKDIAMYGVDAEAGAHVYRWNNLDLYTGIGPYYFVRGHKDAIGGKARVNARFFADCAFNLSLEGTVSYDSLFKDIYQGQLSISFPLARSKKVEKGRHKGTCSDFTALQRRLVLPVVRDEIIVIKRKKKNSVAINPATGLPYQVWFVNNTSSSLGTFESPYPTLEMAQNASSPNDIIYVFSGNGTTTGMDSGITMQAGQKLLGSGTKHPLSTTAGTITIPAFTNINPILSSTLLGSDGIVLLANNNEIAGLTLDATNGRAGILYQESDPISGLLVRNNLILGGPGGSGTGTGSGSTAIAIRVENLDGDLTVHDNTFIGGTAGTGISTTTAINGNSKHYIFKNTISGFVSSAIDLEASESGARSFASIHNNTITGEATGGGISIITSPTDPDESFFSAMVEDNQFNDINGTALALHVSQSSNSSGLFQVTGNTFNNCSTPFNASVDTVGQTSCVIFNNNTAFTNSGPYVFDGTNGLLKAAIDDNIGDLQVVGTIHLSKAEGFQCVN
ncbi:MAG: inverse autotransporter beta domain-containing protein [Chlamydiales bacterium]|nr:inverse autotransporter beta domain-containing protein [Chlamydiales bacterium]